MCSLSTEVLVNTHNNQAIDLGISAVYLSASSFDDHYEDISTEELINYLKDIASS